MRLHACECLQVCLNMICMCLKPVTRSLTLTGRVVSSASVLHDFILALIGIVLWQPVWLWDQSELLVFQVPKVRTTDTCVSLATYSSRSLDSIVLTLLPPDPPHTYTHSHVHIHSVIHACTHTLSHMHTHTYARMHTHTNYTHACKQAGKSFRKPRNQRVGGWVGGS